MLTDLYSYVHHKSHGRLRQQTPDDRDSGARGGSGLGAVVGFTGAGGGDFDPVFAARGIGDFHWPLQARKIGSRALIGKGFDQVSSASRRSIRKASTRSSKAVAPPPDLILR